MPARGSKFDWLVLAASILIAIVLGWNNPIDYYTCSVGQQIHNLSSPQMRWIPYSIQEPHSMGWSYSTHRVHPSSWNAHLSARILYLFGFRVSTRTRITIRENWWVLLRGAAVSYKSPLRTRCVLLSENELLEWARALRITFSYLWITWIRTLYRTRSI